MAGLLAQIVRDGYTARITLLAALSIGHQLCELAAPVLFGKLIDRLLAGRVEPAPALPADTGLAALVAVWIVSFLLLRGLTVADLYTMPAIRARAQGIVLSWLFGHSPRYFQDNFAGSLGQKVRQSGESVMHLLNILHGEVPRLLVAFLVSGILLWRVEPGYALFLLGWILAYLGVSILLARRCIPYSREFQQAASQLSGTLIDTLANFDVVRSFARGDYELGRIGEAIDEEARRSRRLRWFLALVNATQALAMLLLLVAFAVMGLRDAAAGRIGIGDFAMLLGLGGLIVANSQNLSFRFLDLFQHAGIIREAIDDILVPHEITDHPGALPLQVTGGRIRMSGIRFAHPGGSPVFEGLDLDIAPGEKVGLVGPSGAGKSTLLRLLRRHYTPQEGQIEIDHQDIARVTWESLNRAIGDVPQTPGIFHRSLLDNIRYADLQRPEDAVRDYAVAAHVQDFVERRPEGYAVIVGEQGIKLSGGERQRVAIARALLKDARILVLDEATSALDSESEALVQRALWELFEGRTVVAIAHRLTTLTGMDRILYLDRGRILEQGSHAGLLARNGAYARLWRRHYGEAQHPAGPITDDRQMTDR